MSQVRLSREDWVHAGRELLLEEGYSALKVASLAKSLGVTKGSFYWHFASVTEFHDELLEHWRKVMIDGVIGSAKTADDPIDTLRAMLGASDLPDYDVAVRQWAGVESKVAKAVARADRLRARRFADMLKARGVSKEVADLRGQMLLWVWGGSSGAKLSWRRKVMGEAFALVSGR